MEEYDLSSSEDYDSDAVSEDGQRKRDWRQMRRKFLGTTFRSLFSFFFLFFFLFFLSLTFG